jgi:lipoate-protein ligase A
LLAADLAAENPGESAGVWVVEADQRCLVLGSAQDRSTATDAVGRGDYADVSVLQRRSGGGAVWVDPLTTVWIEIVVPTRSPRYSPKVDRSTDWLGHAISTALGTLSSGPFRPVSASGSDQLGRLVCFGGLGSGEVMVDGRKVVGVSQRRGRWGSRFQLAVYSEFDPVPLVDLVDTSGLKRGRDELAAELSERAGGVGHPPSVIRRVVLDAVLDALE